MFDHELIYGPGRYLLVHAVTIVVQLICLIVALCFVRRYPKPALLVIVASGIALVTRCAWPFFVELAFRQGWEPLVLTIGGWVAAILHAVSWLVLVLAVFSARRGGASSSIGVVAAADESRPLDPSFRGSTTVKPMSKGLYLGSIIGGLVLSWLLVVPGYVLMLSGGSDEQLVLGGGLVCVGWAPTVYAIVMIAVLIHKIWAAIQPGPARTTPGKAVGFLFIPFFNFYWIFQAYWGWTVDYNRYVAQAQIAAPRAPEGLALTICILMLCAIIPILGMLISLVNLVLMLVFFNAALNGVNAIAAAYAAGVSVPQPTPVNPPTSPPVA